MGHEYKIGRQRTRQQNYRTISLCVKKRVYDRLCAMQRALQAEIGDEIEVSIASVVRKILYQHPALRTVARRHYQQDTGDDVVL